MINYRDYVTRFGGKLILGACGHYLVLCDWTGCHSSGSTIKRVERFFKNSSLTGGDATLDNACRQLDEYFRGERKEFDIELKPTGSEKFQLIAKLLREIPYGQTLTYAGLAAKAELTSAHRAVGAMVKSNPISIFIPCHRIIAGNGLGGYRGGQGAKEKLLQLEQAIPASLL